MPGLGHRGLGVGQRGDGVAEHGQLVDDVLAHGSVAQVEMPGYVVGSHVASISGVTSTGFQPTSSSNPDGVRQ